MFRRLAQLFTGISLNVICIDIFEYQNVFNKASNLEKLMLFLETFLQETFQETFLFWYFFQESK